MDIPTWILFLALVISLIFSAFFSSSETAMMSLDRYRLKHLVEQKNRSAILVDLLLSQSDRLISLILLGNNFVNIFASMLATLIALRLGGEYALAIATGVLTLTVLIFAEVAPKTIAIKHPEKVAFFAVYLLVIFDKLFSPFTFIVNKITTGFLWLLGQQQQDSHLHFNIAQLRSVINNATEAIPVNTKKMLTNLLDLESITVQDVILPLNEIVAIDLEDSEQQIWSLIANSPYNRLPLYQDSIENIIGVIHVRDVIGKISDFDKSKLIDMAEPPYYIPEHVSLISQIDYFREQKQTFAIVVDEYGSVKGMITMSDILEQVVGDYTSNISDSISNYEQIEDNVILVKGNCSLRELEIKFHIQFDSDMVTTINGFLIDKFGDLPPPNCSLKYNNLVFDILQTTEHAIALVRMHLPTSENTENAGS